MNCLICGCKKKENLMRLCSNMEIMGPFFKQKESCVVACENCGHVYVDINAEQKEFTSYYDSDYSKSLSYYEVFGKDETTIYYADIEKRIRQYINKKSKILEIGGGIGELAFFLKEYGYQDITVLEPSVRCIKLCKEKGIKTIHSDGFSVPESEIGKYDFIIINHTLEHILRFDLTLKSAKLLLNDKGHIYIEVPDALRYTDTKFVPYWFFTYEHLFHMSLNSFDNLGISFEIEVIEKESYLKCNSYYVMYAIFRKAKSADKKISYSAVTRDAVYKYITQCENQLKPMINKLEKSQEPLILWGVGTSTAQLLNGNFERCNITKLVDSNSYRQNVVYHVAGKDLMIEAPETIISEKDTIVILPLMYDSSIRKQISDMGLKNRVESLIENYKEDKR